MVSVIIPSYNRAHILKKAVISVLDQSFSDIEVIIVDDGSTDNTREVVASILDERLHYYYQENAGACVARNYGICVAKGEYIAFHDSDDLWKVDKLEIQMRALQLHNADIVFCKLLKHFADGTCQCVPQNYKEGFLNPIESLFGIGTQTLVAKREVFEKYRFDSEMPRFQEFELLYRATKEYSIYCVDQGLVDYFVGADSISSNPEKLYRACRLLQDKHPELVKKYPMMGERMAYCLLQSALLAQKKEKDGGRKYIELSKECSSSFKIYIKGHLIQIGIIR